MEVLRRLLGFRFKPPTEAQKNAVFCELRWTYPVVSLARGDMRYCCRTPARRVEEAELKSGGPEVFLNSAYDRARRVEMLQGKRHSDCEPCSHLESRGMASSRFFDFDFRDRQRSVPEMPIGDWVKIRKGAVTNLDWSRTHCPEIVEIMMSSACDMKCVYCSHHYSTKWAQELLEFGDITPAQLRLQVPTASPSFEETFWQAFEHKMFPTLERVCIIGGEPLINEKLYSIMDRIDQVSQRVERLHSTRKLTISLVTNLNCSAEQLQRFISRFRTYQDRYELDLNVSMESVGERAEYIRHGLNWERWLRNFRTLVETHLSPFGVSLQLAINALCVTSLQDLLQIAAEMSIELEHPILLRRNTVSDPSYLSPSVLTPDFATYLEDAANLVSKARPRCDVLHTSTLGTWYDYEIYLRKLAESVRHGAPQPNGRKALANFLRRNDRRRGSDVLRIFPEYREFLTQAGFISSS